MGAKTTFEWTRDDEARAGASWNSVNGCRRKLTGCRGCYAEVNAARFAQKGMPYEGLIVLIRGGPRWNANISLVSKHLHDPLRWCRPRRIFVNSTSDTFYEAVSDWYLDQIFAIMALSSQPIFQVLTKRPDRMLRYLTGTRKTPGGDLSIQKIIARQVRVLPAKIVGSHGFDADGIPFGGRYVFADQLHVNHAGTLIPLKARPVRPDQFHWAFRINKKLTGNLLDGCKREQFPSVML